MSLFTKCLDCGGNETLEQLLKSCFYVDSDGNQYFNIKFVECSAEDDPAVGCATKPKTLEELVKASIVLNDCGQCALLVSIDQSSIDLICDDCNQQQ